MRPELALAAVREGHLQLEDVNNPGITRATDGSAIPVRMEDRAGGRVRMLKLIQSVLQLQVVPHTVTPASRIAFEEPVLRDPLAGPNVIGHDFDAAVIELAVIE